VGAQSADHPAQNKTQKRLPAHSHADLAILLVERRGCNIGIKEGKSRLTHDVRALIIGQSITGIDAF
jgi:hypothetical protein